MPVLITGQRTVHKNTACTGNIDWYGILKMVGSSDNHAQS